MNQGHRQAYVCPIEEKDFPFHLSSNMADKISHRLPLSYLQDLEIMAPGPDTSWEIDGETVETVSDFIFSGSKITADGDCSHEIKRCLLLGRKPITNLDSILKSRDIVWM